MHTNAHISHGFFNIGPMIFEGIKDGGQFISQENRQYCWRRFMAAQAAVIGGAGNRQPKQIGMLIDGFENGA